MMNKAAILSGNDMLVDDRAKRVRAFFAGHVADNTGVRLMCVRDHLPVYSFPLQDTRS